MWLRHDRSSGHPQQLAAPPDPCLGVRMGNLSAAREPSQPQPVTCSSMHGPCSCSPRTPAAPQGRPALRCTQPLYGHEAAGPGRRHGWGGGGGRRARTCSRPAAGAAARSSARRPGPCTPPAPAAPPGPPSGRRPRCAQSRARSARRLPARLLTRAPPRTGTAPPLLGPRGCHAALSVCLHCSSWASLPAQRTICPLCFARLGCRSPALWLLAGPTSPRPSQPVTSDHVYTCWVCRAQRDQACTQAEKGAPTRRSATTVAHKQRKARRQAGAPGRARTHFASPVSSCGRWRRQDPSAKKATATAACAAASQVGGQLVTLWPTVRPRASDCKPGAWRPSAGTCTHSTGSTMGGARHAHANN